MKKILLTLLAVTLTFSSCKNYDDEFAAASASIAELQTQVAGYSSLQASLTALQASVASLQTTVNALPTTQVDLSGLEADLATSLANIATLQTALNTVVANYVSTADLATTQAEIDALNDALVTLQANTEELLAENNVYNGDLTITNIAELTFAKALANKVTIINGNVTVDIVTNGLDAAEVSSITSKIMSVTGNTDIATDASLDFSALVSVGGFYHVTGRVNMYELKLASTETSAIGFYSTIGADINDDALTYVGGEVVLNYDGGYNQPNLKTAASIQLFDYSNSIDGKASIGSKTATGSTYVGTLTVDFSGLTDCNAVNTINYFSKAINTSSKTSGHSGGYVVFRAATSVKLNAGITYVNAPLADTVDLLAPNYTNGLNIDAQADGSVITIAGRVDNGLSGSSLLGKTLSVTGSPTSTLNADLVSTLEGLTVNNIATALSFQALKAAGAVSAPSTVSFSAPLLVASTVTVAAAKIVSLASTPILNPSIAGSLETLTFTALTSDYTAAATLKTANVTGKVGGDGTFTSTSANLTSAVFAGELDVVSIIGKNDVDIDLLTSVTTSGAIDSFSLIDNAVITSISLGHSHIEGGSGSMLTITNNDKLASLTTSTDFLRTLTVTNNASLETINFASYTHVISAGAINIAIHTNKLSGDFTDAVAVTGTTPYVEAVITSADLATLKPFMAAYKAAKEATVPSTAATMGEYISPDLAGEGTYEPGSLTVNMFDVDPTTETQTLEVAMTANAGLSIVINDGEDLDGAGLGTDLGKAGIDVVAEFLLIQ